MSFFSFLKKSGSSSTTQIRMEEASQIQEMKLLRSIPIFGKMGFKTQKKTLAILISSMVVGTIGTAVSGTMMTEWSLKRTQLSTELQMLALRMPIVGDNATHGDSSSFDILNEAYKKVKENISALKEGKGIMPGTSGFEAIDDLERYLSLWVSAEPLVQKIEENKDVIIEVSDLTKNISDSILISQELAKKLFVAQSQLEDQHNYTHLLNGLNEGLNSLMASTEILSKSAKIPESLEGSLTSARQSISVITNILLKGDEALGIPPMSHPVLKKRLEEFKVISNTAIRDVDRTVRILHTVKSARDAVATLADKSEMSLALTEAMATTYSGSDQVLSTFVRYFSFAFALLTLMFGFFLGWVILVETKHQSATVEESIMYLMNDLTTIAEGDLTVRARITEDITGAIADSINYTVIQLNTTINSVNDTANRVTAAAFLVREKTDRVRESVVGQSAQIETAANSVMSMTESIHRVAADTEESAKVANESLEAAANGRKAVLEAIQGMEQIRAQIQETSKRIKRLGEANQEVGEIVTLISDMTDQTNVLALNASIQAAAAGEAGRGFRAVATEVQRLAERSETALKRIVALIQTAQSETQNTIVAMERSTQQVVEGAQVTNKAGDALTKIEEVARQLNELMENIQETTSAQTMDAGVISERIGEILEIAKKTTTEMEEASQDIQDINTVAEELKENVAIFKVS